MSEDISQPFLILSGPFFFTQLWNESWSLCAKHADWKHFKVKWSRRKYARYNAITVRSNLIRLSRYSVPLYAPIECVCRFLFLACVCNGHMLFVRVCKYVWGWGVIFIQYYRDRDTQRFVSGISKKLSLSILSLSLSLSLFVYLSFSPSHPALVIICFLYLPVPHRNTMLLTEINLVSFPHFFLKRNTAGDSLYCSNTQTNMSVYQRNLDYSTDIYRYRSSKYYTTYSCLSSVYGKNTTPRSFADLLRLWQSSCTSELIIGVILPSMFEPGQDSQEGELHVHRQL